MATLLVKYGTYSTTGAVIFGLLFSVVIGALYMQAKATRTPVTTGLVAEWVAGAALVIAALFALKIMVYDRWGASPYAYVAVSVIIGLVASEFASEIFRQHWLYWYELLIVEIFLPLTIGLAVYANQKRLSGNMTAYFVAIGALWVAYGLYNGFKSKFT